MISRPDFILFGGMKETFVNTKLPLRVFIESKTDDDDGDDISKLQPKASLTFEFIKTFASTFNPIGSLSSTHQKTSPGKSLKTG